MIIGFSGKIGSGKTTAADSVTKMDARFSIQRFANQLKQAASCITGFQIDMFCSQDSKNHEFEWGGKTTSIGSWLQWFGTDVMRGFDKDVWVKALMNKYSGREFWVIDDVRFKNEADAIRSNGGIVIRLNGDPAGIRAHSKRDLNHVSETDLDDYNFDFVINTDRPIGQTTLEIFDIVNNLD